MRLALIYFSTLEDLPLLAKTINKNVSQIEGNDVLVIAPRGGEHIVKDMDTHVQYLCDPRGINGYQDLPVKTLMACRFIRSVSTFYDGMVKCDVEFSPFLNRAYRQDLNELGRSGAPKVAGRIVHHAHTRLTTYHHDKVEPTFRDPCPPDLIPRRWVQGACYYLNMVAVRKIAETSVWEARNHVYEDTMVSKILGDEALTQLNFFGGENR